jgi:hypothetical protein
MQIVANRDGLGIDNNVYISRAQTPSGTEKPKWKAR